MRIAVTGGRDYTDAARIGSLLGEYAGILVHGAAPGADSIAAEWWRRNCGTKACEPHPADWDGPCRDTCKPGHRRQRKDGSTYCPAAGAYRNQEMVDSGIDVLIAFPGGTGTADMVKRAKAAGVRVRKVQP